MRINNNMLAMNTHRQMGITGGNQSKAMEKLSSGLRINRAGDDAAGGVGACHDVAAATLYADPGCGLLQTL